MDLRPAGRALFRLRGVTPIPFLAAAVGFQRITPGSAAVGVLLVLLGEGIRFWGVCHVGIASRTRTPSPKKFVVGGPYRYVRHPLYLGNFLIGLGIAFAANALFPWVLVAYAVLFGLQYGAFIRLEEEELSRKFGDAHREYVREVPAFLPTGRHAAAEGEAASLERGIRSEWRSLVAHGAVLAALFLSGRWLGR